MVDSSTTSCPARRCAATVSTAAMTYDRSGSRVLRSGVGTQMQTASTSDRASKEVVAESTPEATAARTSAGATSSMYDSPRPIAAVRSSSTSKPTTGTPARAKATASGNPA